MVRAIVRFTVRVRVRVMVRVWVRVRVRLGDAVVRNAVDRKVGNPLKLLYNARAYIIMRASYDSIDNKQTMCGKVHFSTSLKS